MRRLKQDVAKDLPEKVEQTLFVEMGDDQRKAYELKRQYYRKMLDREIAAEGLDKSRFLVLQAFTELRQLASVPEVFADDLQSSAKRQMLVEELHDVIGSGHRALVFANFVAALEGISRDLSKSNIPHLVMTGATQNRQELVRRFQEDDTHKVFLMTLKTGGVGLNLTAADYVFIFDPWWNRAAETQAIDRTHRIGQTNTVFTYRMITKETIEEKILELSQRKGKLADELMSLDSSISKSLTLADIQFALGGI